MIAGWPLDGAATMSTLVVLLLLGACAASIVPRAARVISGLTLVAGAGLVLLLGAQVLDGEPVRAAIGGWLAPLGIEFVADGLGVIASGMTMIVMALVLVAPSSTRDDDVFWVLWSWIAFALVALFLTGDLFNAYVALELIGIAAASLVAIAGTRAALIAATRYLLVGLTASALYLLGVAIVYAHTGTLAIGPALAALDDAPAAGIALGAMTVGLIAKAAGFPLHGWLAPAHSNAPAPASAVLSGLVVKAGIVLAWRIWDALPSSVGSQLATGVFGTLGMAAIVWGAVQAFGAVRLKTLLAYSTIAQVGYLMLVLAMVSDGAEAARGPGMLLALVHAFAKAAAFAVAGILIARFGSDRFEDLGALAARMPIATFTLGISFVALVGLPPTGSFLAKWELLRIAIDAERWLWAAAMLVGTALTAAYLLRPLALAFIGVNDANQVAIDERSLTVPLVLALGTVVLFATASHVTALARIVVGA